MKESDHLAARIYRRLFGEAEGERFCEGITPEACAETPRNFFIQGAALTLTKLGDAMANPKTVLAWMLGALGAPLAMTGWLVPLREALSMLPQIALAAWVQRFPQRKWIWVGGSAAQGAALAGMAAAALSLEGRAAGFAVLASLAVFSLARAVNSIASSDVMGKTVPKRRRGRLGGWSEAAAGGFTLAGSLVLIGPLRDVSDPEPFAVILMLAAALWAVAAAIFAGLREFPGETRSGGGGAAALAKDAAELAWRNFGLLRSDPAFGRFVAARALFLVSALSAPYYLVLARETGDIGLGVLGWFVLAGGVATMASSPFWGLFADISSRRVMMSGAALASLLGVGVWAAAVFAPAAGKSVPVFVAAYFLLSVAHAGVRAGRKTHVVDMAGGDRRTAFVSVGNTVIGLALLAAGALSPLAERFGPAWFILGLSLLGFLGVALAAGLPEAQGEREA